MNNIAINTACYGKQDMKTILDSVKKAGYSYVEFPAMKGICEQVSPEMPLDEVKSLKEELDKRGLKTSGICAIVDFTAGEEEFKYLVGCIQLAEILGADKVITLPGSGPDMKREAALNMLDMLLNGKNIRLELEPVGAEWPGEAFNKVLDEGKYSNIGLNYDTANVLFFGGYDPMKDIDTCLNLIESIHLKDKIGGKGIHNFPAVGTGELPMKEIVKKLLDNGYEGVLTAEIEFTEAGPKDFQEIEDSVKLSYENICSYI